jgi:hypothetical protein
MPQQIPPLRRKLPRLRTGDAENGAPLAINPTTPHRYEEAEILRGEKAG